MIRHKKREYVKFFSSLPLSLTADVVVVDDDYGNETKPGTKKRKHGQKKVAFTPK
jgi:hypothetical protein